MAAYRISKELAKLGIATLRFDFRGLGDSQGKFVDTNFTTQINDIQAAIDYLQQHHASPALLIGHSMGGTASLYSALHNEQVKAAVTIASPSQPSHVLHHFKHAIASLNAGNNAVIQVGGSDYEVSPGFVDDLLQYDMQASLASLHKPVLVFDVEGDDIVAASNAADIVEWCGSHTEKISLKDTDHLVSNRQTAISIANSIKAFLNQSA